MLGAGVGELFMKRRDFLRAGAVGGASAVASAFWPQKAVAEPFGTTPSKHAGVMLPPAAESQSILECFLYGGLTTWETFYCVPEFGEATKTWAHAHYQQMIDASVACGYDLGEIFTPFAEDATGRTIFLGPYMKPLLTRPDVLDRMRIVVTRHALEPHEAAIPLAASGKSLGQPSLASLGAHVARYYTDRDDGSHPSPFAYTFATGSNFIPTDNVLSLIANGLHPGSAKPLLVKVDNATRLNSLLARTRIGTLDERAEYDALLSVYFNQYQQRLRYGTAEEQLRAGRFQELIQGHRSVAEAETIQGVFSPELFETVPGEACTVTNTINVPAMSMKLATHLLTHPLYPGRHCCVVDTGLRAADGGGGYDTHREAPFTQSRNFNNFLNALLPSIKRPEETDERKIDLDKTMVILNMEFGRAPGAQNGGNGRNHWPYGYVQVLIGGTITKAQRGIYGAIGEDGNATVFASPTENRIAALLAMGIWPFDPVSFSGSNVQDQSEEGLAARSVMKRVLGYEV